MQHCLILISAGAQMDGRRRQAASHRQKLRRNRSGKGDHLHGNNRLSREKLRNVTPLPIYMTVVGKKAVQTPATSGSDWV